MGIGGLYVQFLTESLAADIARKIKYLTDLAYEWAMIIE